MKNFFTILFSLYITILSCATCDCDEVFENHNTTQNQSENENHKADNCSPFCTCGCCATAVIYFQTLSVQLKSITKINARRKFLIDNQHFISTNLQNIWQPPKIS